MVVIIIFMKWLPIILILSLLFVAGCAKTVYVCYDGSERDDIKKCPIVILPKLTDIEAGRAVDNFGTAVAQAKRDTYTRVNIYTQNGTWFSNTLFTNSMNGTIKQVSFRINGKTGDVSCVSGCEYLKPQ
jgi:hypothetical protein